jgi:hypothetical protein
VNNKPVFHTAKYQPKTVGLIFTQLLGPLPSHRKLHRPPASEPN